MILSSNQINSYFYILIVRYHLKDLIHAMISPAGGMDTVKGLMEVGDIFKTQSTRPNAGKYMILVTDGRSGTFQQTMQVRYRIRLIYFNLF